MCKKTQQSTVTVTHSNVLHNVINYNAKLIIAFGALDSSTVALAHSSPLFSLLSFSLLWLICSQCCLLVVLFKNYTMEPTSNFHLQDKHFWVVDGAILRLVCLLLELFGVSRTRQIYVSTSDRLVQTQHLSSG